MIMPFIRLITIYVLVGVAVFVIFNRDGVKQMLGIAGDGGAVAISDPSLPPIPPAATSGDDSAAAAPVGAPVKAPVDVPVDGGTQKPANNTGTDTGTNTGTNAAPATAPATAAAKPAQTSPSPSAVYAPDTADATAAAAPPLQTPQAAAQKPADPVLTRPTPPVAATPNTAAPVQQADVNKRLKAARAAYWKGNSAKAETLYKALIADFPDRVDFAGELGNIYYSSGRTALAAPYYKVVARDLLASGKTAKAQAMLSVLQAIAPEMANDLRARASQSN